jgi:hypothetical protein
MELKNKAVIQVIPDQVGLDEIRVYWEDFELGRGQFTITCYGRAWTSYFGAMSRQTTHAFVLSADTAYLVNRMVDHTLPQKKLKQDEQYLTRIINAIKLDMKG